MLLNERSVFKMARAGERVSLGYKPYFETKDGYRWEIFDKENGYAVVGRDGREQYPSKKEAQYNMPDLYDYYVDKIYYG
jgi:hypothetical protein